MSQFCFFVLGGIIPYGLMEVVLVCITLEEYQRSLCTFKVSSLTSEAQIKLKDGVTQ